MSEQLLQQLKQEVIRFLSKVNEAPPQDLIAFIRKEDPTVDPADIRSAVWYLVSTGDVDFDQRWNLVRAHLPTPSPRRMTA